MNRFPIARFRLLIGVLLLLAGAHPVSAQDIDVDNTPVLLQAD